MRTFYTSQKRFSGFFDEKYLTEKLYDIKTENYK